MPLCFDQSNCWPLLLLVVLFCFVIVGKICYLHLSAVFCWLFPRILLACVIVVVLNKKYIALFKKLYYFKKEKLLSEKINKVRSYLYNIYL